MKRAKSAGTVKDSNLNGDGLTLGGERAGQDVRPALPRTLPCAPPPLCCSAACSLRPYLLPPSRLLLAGLLIFKKGGAVAFSHAEKTFGDHAPLEEVVKAAEAAARG